MIKLTELRFNKETLSFEKVPVMVNEDFISNFGPNKITMSAPTIVACKIFGDDRVPDKYYKEIASTECTTIILKDRTKISVAETLKQIEDIIKKKEKMMKVENLMIGDWVKVNDIEHTHPLQVAEIFKKCGAYYATLYWDGMPDNVNPETLTADVDKVLPIPLTAEILEKNGLHLYNRKTNSLLEQCNHSDCFEEDEDFRVELSLDNDGSIRWTINGDEYTIMPLNYVHQLQHALRLCGIEKEIIL